ncbi:MAG: hypothetical protein IGS03_00715, partial [Candidatus Sericytochromatia bacterium]|nr:hypothetical protein [Candidatus Sericytochromatia bacterium]
MTQPPVFNWATAVGGTVIGGLTLTAAEWVENINQGLLSYGVIEYSCSGSPDLSGVLQGHRLVASDFSSDLNNGTFPVLSANNSSKKIRVLMTGRKDDGADETGAGASGEVISSGALLNPPTAAKQGQGYVPNELPNALQLNWMLNSFGAWTGYIATGAAGVIPAADLSELAAIDTTGFVNRSALVADIGLYRWVAGSALTADGYVVRDSDVAGQWERELDMGDFAPAWLAPDISETLPAVTATLDFSSISASSESTLTVTVPGARV